jgi:hypothetical protein
MIQRYSLLVELEGILEDGASLEMRAYPDGEWVKWEDVEFVLSGLADKLADVEGEHAAEFSVAQNMIYRALVGKKWKN